MGPYHHMMVHFPLALWATATLIILLRAFSSAPLIVACDKVLTPLLGFSVLMGVLAYAIGFLVWPLEAVINSPMARNHLLMASWSLAIWTLIWFVRWKIGDHIWDHSNRWIILLLAFIGSGLFAISGTLGGHLLGSGTGLSVLLDLMGWNINTTFYVPNTILVLIVIATIAIIRLGFSKKG